MSAKIINEEEFVAFSQKLFDEFSQAKQGVNLLKQDIQSLFNIVRDFYNIEPGARPNREHLLTGKEHQKAYIELKVPREFSFTPASTAELLDVSTQVVRRNLQRKPWERYFLKGHQHGKNGKITIYAYDLEDYLRRTEIAFD